MPPNTIHGRIRQKRRYGQIGEMVTLSPSGPPSFMLMLLENYIGRRIVYFYNRFAILFGYRYFRVRLTTGGVQMATDPSTGITSHSDSIYYRAMMLGSLSAEN